MWSRKLIWPSSGLRGSIPGPCYHTPQRWRLSPPRLAEQIRVRSRQSTPTPMESRSSSLRVLKARVSRSVSLTSGSLAASSVGCASPCVSPELAAPSPWWISSKEEGLVTLPVVLRVVVRAGCRPLRRWGGGPSGAWRVSLFRVGSLRPGALEVPRVRPWCPPRTVEG